MVGVNSDDSHHPLLLSASDEGIRRRRQPPECVEEAWTELKKLWGIAAPSIFSRLAMFSLTIITQSLAGHLGQHQLAAISIVTTVVISITFGFLRSWVVLFVSSVALLPLFIFLEPMLKLVGQPQSVAELTGEVALWLIPMHLSFVFQFTLTRFLQCQLKTFVVAWIYGAVLVLHALISWIFVYNMRVGIVGIALTLYFSWWIALTLDFSCLILECSSTASVVGVLILGLVSLERLLRNFGTSLNCR